MRLFAQKFSGEVKKWFRGLQAGSIHDFRQFETIFLGKWEKKINYFHFLTQYNNLKRGMNESVQDFSARFMRTYESILANVKPPPWASKLHYVDAFDSEFTLLLREIRSTSLENMMQDSIEVEDNLSTSNKTKQRGDNRRVKEEAQTSTSQSSTYAKMDLMMKSMEIFIDRLYVDDRGQNVNRERNEPQIRNPNFKQPRQSTPQPPQILQREQRNNNDQVRPPFHQNQVDDNAFPQQTEEHINHVGDSEAKVFVTKEEHDKFALETTSQS